MGSATVKLRISLGMETWRRLMSMAENENKILAGFLVTSTSH